MKTTKIFLYVALGVLSLTSCDKQIMEWGTDKTAIAASDVPLELAEKIERYDVLKNYTDFTLGIGMGLDMYMATDTTYSHIVKSNFDEITIGYAMKHGAMVSATGDINYTSVDALIAKIKAAGLTVYGHTLAWHSNQNASYLNGLIAPTVIPGSSGTNLLSNGDFESGTTGWGSWGSGKSSVGISSDVKLVGSNSLKVVTSASSANIWDLQVQAPAVALTVGHQYEISFWIKSEGTGAARVSFGDATQMSNQYPLLKADNGASTTSTSSAWKQVTYSTSTINATSNFTAVGSSMQFRIDLGKVPNMTYYIDYVSVVDLDAQPVNMISNSTFESGVSGWSAWNGSAPTATSTAYQGTGAMQVVNATSNSGGQWKTQIHSNFSSTLVSGTKYTVSYFVKSDATGSIRCSTSGTTAQYQGDQATGSAWKQVTWDITSNGTETGLNFDLGLVAGTYYIDNVVVAIKSGTTSPVYVDKTAAEKTQIIGNAFTSWITNMMIHYKGSVKAWDVVNEPMNDDATGSVRDGSAATTATDQFYWQKYLGKDYAVTAFKLARQYGNGASDKLFINDYNLESNLAKCDGLINYVKYIETQGATVDGIGTQMHISITTDTLKIDQMFQKLAASGKLIKVSELDIKVNTATPGTSEYASQANMYQYVIKSYMANIPAAQRYGITIWGVSDNAAEHTNWIPNDAPNLWNAKYARKHAYKGCADGLAGKDVSKDFTGIIYTKGK